MKPKTFAAANVTFAKDQPQYLSLPAHMDKDGIVTTCWGLSWRERVKVLLNGEIWFQVMTFKRPLPPQKASTENPIGSGA